MYVICASVFYALLIFSNSLKMIETDRNVLELRKIVCKNIIIH
jgi:hypothetical protein